MGGSLGREVRGPPEELVALEAAYAVEPEQDALAYLERLGPEPSSICRFMSSMNGSTASWSSPQAASVGDV
jgi:hypothetical protein